MSSALLIAALVVDERRELDFEAAESRKDVES